MKKLLNSKEEPTFENTILALAALDEHLDLVA